MIQWHEVNFKVERERQPETKRERDKVPKCTGVRFIQSTGKELVSFLIDGVHGSGSQAQFGLLLVN